MHRVHDVLYAYYELVEYYAYCLLQTTKGVAWPHVSNRLSAAILHNIYIYIYNILSIRFDPCLCIYREARGQEAPRLRPLHGVCIKEHNCNIQLVHRDIFTDRVGLILSLTNY